MSDTGDLISQSVDSGGRSAAPIVVVGEILWDVFPDSVRLGGAPLNFAVHAKRMGMSPMVVSALGPDELGKRAAREITALGLDMTMIRCSEESVTGTASVSVDGDGQPQFHIRRPAAYDELRLTSSDLQFLTALEPTWLYYGTLFPSRPDGRTNLQRLLEALPRTTRFYDVNLRPGVDSFQLVADLLAFANVVKLNESEAKTVAEFLGLPSEAEAFCRSVAARFRWRAVCVTLGERGCALFDGRDFVQADGERVKVVDTVGAGDAFAAAFVHGLSMGWQAIQIARFANRVGASVASRAGAIPE
jgi:fructokinase